MKEVRKKSHDLAVNKMIVKAFKNQRELAWDRADAQQPQCGFGRLAICCTDCYDGPCRINPFGQSDQLTICGRSQADLAAGYFVKKAADGTLALAKLAADSGAELAQDVLKAVSTADSMLMPDYDAQLEKLGQAVVNALTAVSACQKKNSQPVETAANLGVLKADAVNIVLYGQIAPSTVKALAAAAASNEQPVNIVAVCGSEISGDLAIPAVTNYVSQETPLLTGAVDLVVLGTQCVMPAVVKLADELNVPVVSAAVCEAASAIAAATAACQRRAGRSVDIPEISAPMTAGFTLENSPALWPALAKGYAQGVVRGLVYLGGCGTIANTQDEQFVQLAQDLVADGYVLATAGCAGTALAKTGLCAADHPAAAQLAKVLPAGVPAVLYLGACHMAGEFLTMAAAAAKNGLPVFAVVPEIAHNKVLATAVGFAQQGITTFLSVGEAAVMAKLHLKGRMLPLSDLGQLPQVMAEVAAAK